MRCGNRAHPFSGSNDRTVPLDMVGISVTSVLRPCEPLSFAEECSDPLYLPATNNNNHNYTSAVAGFQFITFLLQDSFAK